MTTLRIRQGTRRLCECGKPAVYNTAKRRMAGLPGKRLRAKSGRDHDLCPECARSAYLSSRAYARFVVRTFAGGAK